MSSSEGSPRGARRRRALVLLGHGSHLNADSSAPVFANAQRIRDRGLFDEVIEGFWKEEPGLPDVLDLVESDEIYVVPLFLAEGYFTRRVLPRELGLSGPRSVIGDRTVHYCPPVGAHSAMRRLILERALGALRDAGGQPDRAALVVIGHGTPRSSTSGDSVYWLVDALRETRAFAAVECGFLDQDPRIEDVVAGLDEDRIVLVPFFVAEGWHAAETVPRELGIDGDVSAQGGRTIHYTPPVGTLPEIVDVILDIARDAGAFEPDEAVPADFPGADGGPREIAAARGAFLGWVADGGNSGREFLQLLIRRSGADAFELRHRDDRDRPASVLRGERDPRAAVRIARLDPDGRYRPLRTARSLAAGWIMQDLSADDLWTAVSLFYPAAVLHWYRWKIGTLAVVPFSASAQRQSGAYEGLRQATPELVEAAVASCCASCARARLWDLTTERVPLDPSAAPPGSAIIPCAEPCTLLRTSVRLSMELAEASA